MRPHTNNIYVSSGCQTQVCQVLFFVTRVYQVVSDLEQVLHATQCMCNILLNKCVLILGDWNFAKFYADGC